MKKVFIVHGFNSSPNSSWIPWLMGELKSKEVYACSLFMPTPESPICAEWVQEISRIIDKNKNDELYLVGYSLGVAAILNYLESVSDEKFFNGVVLVSGRCIKSNNQKTEGFYKEFDFKIIKNKVKKFSVIHGDNDDRVLVFNGEKLAGELGVKLTIVVNGGHLNGSAGWRTLPQCLEALEKMF